MNIIEGTARGDRQRFAILVTRTNSEIEDALLKGTADTLLRHGAEEQSITTIRVPGVWELPITLEMAAQSEAFDAVIMLGASADGNERDYDLSIEEIRNRGTAVSLQTGKPVTFRIVGAYAGEEMNETRIKGLQDAGREAAMTALEMTDLLSRIGRHDREYMTSNAV